MKTKNIILLVSMAAICMWSGPSVNAGSPFSAASTPGAANLKGRVKFDGVVPKPHPINMAADPSCAKLHSAPVLTQDIVADDQGGLQNAIVFVSDGLGDRVYEPPTQPAVLEQKGCMYQPHVTAMRANQPFEVVNDDPTGHNIHPMPLNNREWNKAEPPGSKMDESFGREEVAIPVRCNIHPWMHTYVAVFKHPFFAITGKDGTFDLSNLPPGTYTIEAWQEKLGTVTQKITLGSNETKEIELVFKPRPGSI
jgi:hypothetical protein